MLPGKAWRGLCRSVVLSGKSEGKYGRAPARRAGMLAPASLDGQRSLSAAILLVPCGVFMDETLRELWGQWASSARRLEPPGESMVDYSNIPADSRRVPLENRIQLKFDR